MTWFSDHEEHGNLVEEDFMGDAYQGDPKDDDFDDNYEIDDLVAEQVLWQVVERETTRKAAGSLGCTKIP